MRGGDISHFVFLQPVRFKSVLIFLVLPALDAAYHHVSGLCLQQVGNVLSFAGRDRGLGELWNT